MISLWLAGCGPPPCPEGFAPDPERTAEVWAYAGHRTGARLCFGPEPERGVVDAQGRFRLDQGTDDRLLAARVVHLAAHRAAVIRGPGCETQLRREEAAAWWAEVRHRAVLGVVDPGCPVARLRSLQAVEAWIGESSHAVAAALRASHARRCGS